MTPKVLKLKILTFLFISTILFVFPAMCGPTNWSRFISTKSRDDVIISFRQKRKNHAWSIEWQVRNNSGDKVEPILISRNYICKNGNSQLLNQQSLGVYLPGTHRKGDIKDRGICPNSTIDFVKIESEIHLIPDNTIALKVNQS